MDAASWLPEDSAQQRGRGRGGDDRGRGRGGLSRGRGSAAKGSDDWTYAAVVAGDDVCEEGEGHDGVQQRGRGLGDGGGRGGLSRGRGSAAATPEVDAWADGDSHNDSAPCMGGDDEHLSEDGEEWGDGEEDKEEEKQGSDTLSAYTDFLYEDSASPCLSQEGDDTPFPVDTPWVADCTVRVTSPLTAENLARLQAIGDQCNASIQCHADEDAAPAEPAAVPSRVDAPQKVAVTLTVDDAATLETALRLCCPALKPRETVYAADHLWTPAPTKRGLWPCDCRHDESKPAAALHCRMAAAAEPGLALRRVVPHRVVPPLLLWWAQTDAGCDRSGPGIVAQFLDQAALRWASAAELHAASPMMSFATTNRTDVRINHALAGIAALQQPSSGQTAPVSGSATAVDLHRSTVTDAGVAALAAAVPALRYLRLSLCRRFSDAVCAAAAAAKFKSLVDLDLSESRPTTLRPLVDVPTLRRLRMCHNDGRLHRRGVPECAAADLPLLTQLRSLFISGHVEMPEDVWSAVSTLPLLELKMTVDCGEGSAPFPPTLTHLTVELAPGASEGLLSCVGGCGRMWGQVSLLEYFEGLPELQHLVVWADVAELDLFEAVTLLPKLRTLKVFHCEPIQSQRQEAIELPAGFWPELKDVCCSNNAAVQMSIDASACPDVTSRTVSTLAEAMSEAASVEPCLPELAWTWPRIEAPLT